MTLTRSRLAGGLALLALTTSACGMGGDSGSTGAGGGDGNGHLVYAEFYPPTSAWALSSDDALTLSRAGCLETLVEYTSDGELVEMLATSWEQVEPTAWEFTLREGVKFQDGTPMDADAVAGALTHLLARGRSVIALVEGRDSLSGLRPSFYLPLFTERRERRICGS